MCISGEVAVAGPCSGIGAVDVNDREGCAARSCSGGELNLTCHSSGVFHLSGVVVLGDTEGSYAEVVSVGEELRCSHAVSNDAVAVNVDCKLFEGVFKRYVDLVLHGNGNCFPIAANENAVLDCSVNYCVVDVVVLVAEGVFVAIKDVAVVVLVVPYVINKSYEEAVFATGDVIDTETVHSLGEGIVVCLVGGVYSDVLVSISLVGPNESGGVVVLFVTVAVEVVADVLNGCIEAVKSGGEVGVSLAERKLSKSCAVGCGIVVNVKVAVNNSGRTGVIGICEGCVYVAEPVSVRNGPCLVAESLGLGSAAVEAGTGHAVTVNYPVGGGMTGHLDHFGVGGIATRAIVYDGAVLEAGSLGNGCYVVVVKSAYKIVVSGKNDGSKVCIEEIGGISGGPVIGLFSECKNLVLVKILRIYVHDGIKGLVLYSAASALHEVTLGSGTGCFDGFNKLIGVSMSVLFTVPFSGRNTVDGYNLKVIGVLGVGKAGRTNGKITVTNTYEGSKVYVLTGVGHGLEIVLGLIDDIFKILKSAATGYRSGVVREVTDLMTVGVVLTVYEYLVTKSIVGNNLEGKTVSEVNSLVEGDDAGVVAVTGVGGEVTSRIRPSVTVRVTCLVLGLTVKQINVYTGTDHGIGSGVVNIVYVHVESNVATAGKKTVIVVLDLLDDTTDTVGTNSVGRKTVGQIAYSRLAGTCSNSLYNDRMLNRPENSERVRGQTRVGNHLECLGGSNGNAQIVKRSYVLVGDGYESVLSRRAAVLGAVGEMHTDTTVCHLGHGKAIRELGFKIVTRACRVLTAKELPVVFKRCRTGGYDHHGKHHSKHKHYCEYTLEISHIYLHVNIFLRNKYIIASARIE